MTLIINDRVKETSTTDGDGTLALAGAVDGYEGFVAAIGDTNTTYYCIQHATVAEWEVGLGTVGDASPDTLARTTVISSSNADAKVPFSAGTKDVFCTIPASRLGVYPEAPTATGVVYVDANGLQKTDGATWNGTQMEALGTSGVPGVIVGRTNSKVGAIVGATSAVVFCFDDAGAFGILAQPHDSILSSPGASGTYALYVTTTAMYVGGSMTSATPSDAYLKATSGVGLDVPGADFYHDAGQPTGDGTGGSHIFRTAKAGVSGTETRDLANAVSILETGAIGIGEDSPIRRLEIRTTGTDADQPIEISDSTITDHGMTALAATDAYFSLWRGTNALGGTKIFGLSSGDLEGLNFSGVIGSDNPTDTTPAIVFRGTKKNGTSHQALGNSETVIKFLNHGSTLAVVRGDGGVGLGTDTPSERLEVNGNVKATTYMVGANQVVGAQGAAVAHATDAASAITQLNLVIDRLRAHGTFAT